MYLRVGSYGIFHAYFVNSEVLSYETEEGRCDADGIFVTCKRLKLEGKRLTDQGVGTLQGSFRDL